MLFAKVPVWNESKNSPENLRLSRVSSFALEPRGRIVYCQWQTQSNLYVTAGNPTTRQRDSVVLYAHPYPQAEEAKKKGNDALQKQEFDSAIEYACSFFFFFRG